MNEQDAKAALRVLGIRNPSRALIQNWLRSQTAEIEQGVAVQVPEARSVEIGVDAPEKAAETHSSESKLLPRLREEGTLERPSGRRKPGRPRIIASWFPKVAGTMADGTSLRTALAMNNLKLSKSEVRACYRNRTLRALYTETRRRYLAEPYGRGKPSLRAIMGRSL